MPVCCPASPGAARLEPLFQCRDPPLQLVDVGLLTGNHTLQFADDLQQLFPAGPLKVILPIHPLGMT